MSTSSTPTTTSSATAAGAALADEPGVDPGTRSARTRRSARPTVVSSRDGCRGSRRTWRRPSMTGSEHVLIEDWCQQFPSHSLGALMFGPGGRPLRLSGRRRELQRSPDYGQFGGTLPARRHRSTHAAIRRAARLVAADRPRAARCAARTSGRPATRRPGRLDPARRPGHRARLADNANIGSDDATPAGSSPMACATRSGSRSSRVPTMSGSATSAGHLGGDRPLTDPDGDAGELRLAVLRGGRRPLRRTTPRPVDRATALRRCASRRRTSRTTTAQSIVSGDGCGTGSSSISGMAFLPSSSIPEQLRQRPVLHRLLAELHLVHAGRRNGSPTCRPVPFANLDAGGDTDGGAVSLTIGPTGDLVYADYDRGEVRRIHYYGGQRPARRVLHGDAVVRSRPAHCHRSTPVARATPKAAR